MAMFKCETIIFYVPLGCIFILELFILGNIEKQIFITSVTKVQGLNDHQYLRFRHQRLETLSRKTCEIYSF